MRVTIGREPIIQTAISLWLCDDASAIIEMAAESQALARRAAAAGFLAAQNAAPPLIRFFPSFLVRVSA
ncbi:MAG: hypothetical protein J2P49_01610 [Methylocapsa sp.]|nr:hypothetical protein [Methylocapsa sp.]